MISHLSFCFCALLFHLHPQHLHLLLGAIENDDVLVFEWIPTLMAKRTKKKIKPGVRSHVVAGIKTLWMITYLKSFLPWQNYAHRKYRGEAFVPSWGLEGRRRVPKNTGGWNILHFGWPATLKPVRVLTLRAWPWWRGWVTPVKRQRWPIGSFQVEIN